MDAGSQNEVEAVTRLTGLFFHYATTNRGKKMLTERDIELITKLVKKHAAETLTDIIQVARNTSRGYAAKTEEMRQSAIANGRDPQRPYDELDYRTCELLERQAQRIFEDSWMGLEDFKFEGYDL